MAWYKTGTIAISGATVTGTGTNWTDNKLGIGPGQALLIPGAGTVKMYEILRVDSATKITLTSSAGTVAAGSAYAIMSFYTDSVPDFARRLAAQLSYYQSQMDGWQQIMTGTGTINIEAPDGTIVAISSFKKLTDDMSGKMDKSQNLNDLPNKATARTNLGLGTAATLSAGGSVIDYATNIVVRNRDFGIGGSAGAGEGVPIGNFGNNANYMALNGWYGGAGAAAVNHFEAYSPLLTMCRFAGGYIGQIQITNTGKMGVRGGAGATVSNQGTWTSWFEVYTTGNTTKASDGTLKAASPVCRIVKSQAETERADVDEEGFSWCGAGTANEEASGIEITRQDVGVYVITGAAGLAEEGWRLLPPRDPDGSGDLGIVEADESDDGITVRLYKRRWQLTDDGDIEPVKGVPIDVPLNSWIDVRLSMPVKN